MVNQLLVRGHDGSICKYCLNQIERVGFLFFRIRIFRQSITKTLISKDYSMASQQRNAQTSFRAQKIQALQQAWVEVSARLAQRMDRSVPFSPSRKFIYADMIASRHPTLDQTEWHDGSIQDT